MVCGAHRLPHYVERLKEIFARLGTRPIHLETSSQDPFLDVNRAFHKALGAAGIASTLTVGNGPHDQPWLREAGTLEMLLFHDRL